jgi:tRNA(fMet)-specific endonuclease VapC
MAFLLDTNICIHLRQGHAGVARHFRTKRGEGIVSVVSYGELLFGVQRSGMSHALSKLEELMTAMRLEALPLGAAHHYGRIRNDLGRRGQLIGNNDLWIAAHALAGDYTLVTDNEREFSRVEGLRIENWVREAS